MVPDRPEIAIPLETEFGRAKRLMLPLVLPLAGWSTASGCDRGSSGGSRRSGSQSRGSG